MNYQIGGVVETTNWKGTASRLTYRSDAGCNVVMCVPNAEHENQLLKQQLADVTRERDATKGLLSRSDELYQEASKENDDLRQTLGYAGRDLLDRHAAELVKRDSEIKNLEAKAAQLAAELKERDDRIAELQSAPPKDQEPEPAKWQYRSRYDRCLYRHDGAAFELKATEASSCAWIKSGEYQNWQACCDDTKTFPCDEHGKRIEEVEDTNCLRCDRREDQETARRPMTDTNHDLARVAAENERLARQAMAMIQAADLSIGGGIKIIRDTYAPAMAELERLQADNAFLRELAEFAVDNTHWTDFYNDKEQWSKWLEFEHTGTCSPYKIKSDGGKELHDELERLRRQSHIRNH